MGKMNGSSFHGKKRLHWHCPHLLFILQLFCLAQVCSGQRVITSLGTRLKRLRNKSQGNSRNDDREYIVEGEEEPAPKYDFPFTFYDREMDKTSILALAVGSVTLFIFALYNNSKSREQEGEWVYPSIL
jgi:hypothetical protein